MSKAFLAAGVLVATAIVSPAIVSPAIAEVPPAVQSLRRHMLDADFNALTFRSMDQLFDTSRVDAGDEVWSLPRAEVKLDFTYTHDGRTIPALEALERTFTNALIVLKRGKVVAEIYRNNTNERTHFISWSMAKSVTSILIGQAIADGHIASVDDPVTKYIPELEHSAYQGVALRHVLTMRSGANFEERYDFGRPGLASAAFEESLVSGNFRYASFARLLTRAHEPGERFNYSTVDTCVLGWVLERATGQSISRYMSRKLWQPLGAESYGYWILDGLSGVGREFNGAGFNAVARDYARLGLMMLRQGKAERAQIVPADWVAESTVPAGTEPTEPGASFGYQYQWWTASGSDAYAARGLAGQYIYVDPATETVIVKLSHYPPADMKVDEEALAFLRAASAWQPR